MQEHTYSYKEQLKSLEEEQVSAPDKNSLGANIGRLCVIFDTMRDAEGRSPEGRIWAMLSTDAEKLLAMAIGFGAAEREIPERFQIFLEESDGAEKP